jgi:hypothetical protein
VPLQSKSELVNRTRELVQVLDRTVSDALERQPGPYTWPANSPPPSVSAAVAEAEPTPSPLYFIDTDSYEPPATADSRLHVPRSTSRSPLVLGAALRVRQEVFTNYIVDEIEREFNQYNFPDLNLDT